MKRIVAILKAIKVRVTKSNREMHQVDNCGSRELWSIETVIETVLEFLIVTVTLTVGEVWQWLGDQNDCCRDTPRLVVV
jgi:hypothetical protein